jgi:putative ABC transport system substrate-binding protein
LPGEPSLEEKNPGGKVERLPALAGELVELRVDVIITDDAVSARAAAEATDSIPIVSLLRVDPVEVGLAKQVDNPEGNVTGVLTYQHQEVENRFDILQELAPDLERIGVMFDPTTLHGADVWTRAKVVGAARAITVERLAVELFEKPDSDINGCARDWLPGPPRRS